MHRFLLITALLFAQDTTIRVTNRLVQVNVVVRDSHGPVAGLTKKDFKIFDKGKEQKIALFNVSGTSFASGAPAAAKPNQPLPAGVFTNRPKTHDDTPIGASVLLIDVLNTQPADQQVAQKQILQFLSSLDSQRPVAIYLLSSGIRVLQDFTDDSKLLRKAVTAFHGGTSPTLAAANAATPPMPTTGPPGGADNVVREAFAEMRDSATVDRVSLTLAALSQIANHLAQIPGRKSLIWISSGFPFYLINDEGHNFLAANRENRTFQEDLARTSRSLSDADVAIYPVDARGLLGQPDFDVSQSCSEGPAPCRPNGIVNPHGPRFGNKGNGQLGAMSVDTPEGLDTMRALAEGTGGVAFYNTNDIKGAISKSMADGDLSYTLGFYADSSANDGFHELKVKADRPGVEIRHRKGYLASVANVPKESDIASVLNSTATGELDSTAIGLIAAMDSSRLVLRINFEDLSLEKHDGKWTGSVDIAYLSESSSGRNLALVTKKISLSLTDEIYAAKRRDGLILEQPIEKKKGLARVRIAVLDEGSGATGSLSVTSPDL